MKLIFLNKMVTTGDNWFYLLGNGHSINSNYLDGFIYKRYLNSEYISEKIYYWIDVKAQSRYIISSIKDYRYED